MLTLPLGVVLFDVVDFPICSLNSGCCGVLTTQYLPIEHNCVMNKDRFGGVQKENRGRRLGQSFCGFMITANRGMPAAGQLMIGQ